LPLSCVETHLFSYITGNSAATVTQPENEACIQSGCYMTKTVLVADDNKIIRREICNALTRELEFEVCGEAHHGLDAIEKAEILNPDLIILDLSMPVMNGIDAAKALKARMPSVPIIMFTSYGDAFVNEQLRLAGVAEVVSKSEDVSVLTAKARTLLYQSA
jgi:DNA-binding NarL/FixJ family response regulator